MAELSDFLKKPSPVVEAIYANYKKEGDSEPSRGYLGASIIGHPCERSLWFAFRGCCKPEFSGRMYRLFETGDLAEDRFAKNLRDIGCTVHTHDENGEQFAVSAFGGHFSGHMDGCILGVPGAEKTWHVLEEKTHSNKNFKKLVKEGVSMAFWKHHAQMQIYMHLTGMGRALYLATNKDTDDLYAERLRYSKDDAEKLMERAERIITNPIAPNGLSDRRDFWQCKFCDAKDICFGSPSDEPVLVIPSLSCRQCCHATPKMDGISRWVCEKHGKSLSHVDQATPCKDHLLLPSMLPAFIAEEYSKDENGNDFIRFKASDGSEWEHGKGNGKFSSRELMKINLKAILNPMVAKAKETFNATVTGCCTDLLEGCPEGQRSVLWKGRPSGILAAWDALRAKWGPGPNDKPLSIMKALEYTSLPTHCVAKYHDGMFVVSYTIENRSEIFKLIP